MTDINGVPIINSEAPTEPPKSEIAVVSIPIELERGQNIVQMKVRAPGIIRGAALWLKTPTVLGSVSMRATEKQAMPLLFVECDPARELLEKVYLFLQSDRPFAPAAGYTTNYRATAITQVGGQVGAMHIYEIVQVRSAVEAEDQR